MDVRVETFGREAARRFSFLIDLGFVGPVVDERSGDLVPVVVSYSRGSITVRSGLLLAPIGEDQVFTEIVADRPDGSASTRNVGEHTAHTGHEMCRALDLQGRSLHDDLRSSGDGAERSRYPAVSCRSAEAWGGFRRVDLIGWWVAEDDKAVLIETSRQDGPDSPLLVSAFPSPGAEPYRAPGLSGAGTKRIERLVATPISVHDTFCLRIEAGLDGLGPTYHLYPVVRCAGGGWGQPGGLRAPQESPAALLPTVGMGLYDDWDDDFGVPWAFPLNPLVPRGVGHTA